MNSRTSSFSVPITRAQRRPSVSSRLSFAISNAEQGEGGAAPNGPERQIDEEIDEIKRYEVYLKLSSFLVCECGN
jgi:chloride channel 3/4/5